MSNPDPFAGGEKRPSVSFKNAPIGTLYRGRVIEEPKRIQARDYESGKPDYWDDEKTEPKMTVVIGLDVNGEERSLWAPIPSSMFAAIKEAIKTAGGAPIQVGGELAVKLTEEKPNEKNPRLNPQKIYVARYTPPANGGGADPFDAPAAAAPAPTPAPAAPVYDPNDEPF